MGRYCTAAHCVENRFLTKLKVKIGKYVHFDDADPTDEGQKLEARIVDEWFIHPNWNSQTYEHDIALLHLSKPSTITPIPLDGDNVVKSYTSGEYFKIILIVEFI